MGSETGSEVVQVYIAMPPSSVHHPLLQLRGFQKVKDLAPGKSTKVTVKLDKYAISFWDEPKARWRAEKGTYVVRVGTSSGDLPLKGEFGVESAFEWTGL